MVDLSIVMLVYQRVQLMFCSYCLLMRWKKIATMARKSPPSGGKPGQKKRGQPNGQRGVVAHPKTEGAAAQLLFTSPSLRSECSECYCRCLCSLKTARVSCFQNTFYIILPQKESDTKLIPGSVGCFLFRDYSADRTSAHDHWWSPEVQKVTSIGKTIEKEQTKKHMEVVDSEDLDLAFFWRLADVIIFDAGSHSRGQDAVGTSVDELLLEPRTVVSLVSVSQTYPKKWMDYWWIHNLSTQTLASYQVLGPFIRFIPQCVSD